MESSNREHPAQAASGQASDGDAASQAQDKAKQAAGQAQEKVGQAAGQARERIRDQVDQRSTQAGEQVKANASDVRTVAEELRKQGKDGPAKYADQAADRAERAGRWLTDSNGDAILRDIEDLGRKNPWAVVAGGLALGFAASRLLKASSSERYRASSHSSPSSQGSPAPSPSGLDASREGRPATIPSAPPVVTHGDPVGV